MKNEKIPWFNVIVLFLILCILVCGIKILKVIRKPPLPPPVKIEKPKYFISIILDDWGWNLKRVEEIEEIKEPLTLSILPFSPYSKDVIERLKGKNFEFLLHLPLQPKPPSQCLDKGLIRVDMEEDEIIEQFHKDIGVLYPYVKGVNNHMGSLFTSNEKKMRILLNEIKKMDLFFVDSMTSRNSCGYYLAKKMGIKTAKRDVFLDNSSDPEIIKKNLYKLVKIAKKKKKAIGIGHARKNTIMVLKREIPKIKKEGIEIVYVSELLE